MDEIIRIEDKAHCLLNKQCDRLKKLWGEGTYLTISDQRGWRNGFCR